MFRRRLKNVFIAISMELFLHHASSAGEHGGGEHRAVGERELHRRPIVLMPIVRVCLFLYFFLSMSFKAKKNEDDVMRKMGIKSVVFM